MARGHRIIPWTVESFLEKEEQKIREIASRPLKGDTIFDIKRRMQDIMDEKMEMPAMNQKRRERENAYF